MTVKIKTDAPAASDDLETMIPQAKTVKVKDKEFLIKPMLLRQVPEVIKAVAPFQHMFVKRGETIDYMELAAMHSGAVSQTICALTEEDPEWVGSLDLNEAYTLIEALVVANLDFFTRRLFPFLLQGMELLRESLEVKARIVEHGRTASSPSSPPVTN